MGVARYQLEKDGYDVRIEEDFREKGEDRFTLWFGTELIGTWYLPSRTPPGTAEMIETVRVADMDRRKAEEDDRPSRPAPDVSD